MNQRNKMFLVPVAIVESKAFRAYKATAKLVYFYLLKISSQSADQEGWIQVTSVTLNRMTGIRRGAILRAKEQLVKDGYIELRDKNENTTHDARRSTRIKVKDWKDVLKVVNKDIF
jgi:hypothetical protein